MTRITVKDVRAAAESVSKNMRLVGFLKEDQHLVLMEPVRGCGDVYRLHTTQEGQGGYGVTGLLPGGSVDGSYLGHTAREATRALEIVNAGLLRLRTYQSNQVLAKLGTARPAFTGSASGEKQEDGQ